MTARDRLTSELAARIDAHVAKYRASTPHAPLAVGVLLPGGEVVRTFGEPRPCDRTLFAVGSITKVFTALLLARTVEAGRVGLDDPIPADLRPGGVPITFRQLATHTSGLPRLPSDMWRELNSGQPYANYTEERLRHYLRRRRPATQPGAVYTYSNLGYAVLGVALEEVNGESYAVQLRHLMDELGLEHTFLDEPSEESDHWAMGHRTNGTPVEPWRFDAFAPAGALRSDVHDLLAFARHLLQPSSALALTLQTTAVRTHPPAFANLRGTLLAIGATLAFALLLPNNSLFPLMGIFTATQTGGWAGGAIAWAFWIALRLSNVHAGVSLVDRLWLGAFAIALAWCLQGRQRLIHLGLAWHQRSLKGGAEVFWHNGGVAGFRSFLGIDRERGTAVVLLSGAEKSVDGLGLGLLQHLAAKLPYIPEPDSSPKGR